MACTPAPACKAALLEASHRWPGRSRVSDGICPSLAHTAANPTSDHELGNAFDLTHDIEHGVNCHDIAEYVKYDPRIKYVIWNRRIWNPSVIRRWRTYNGPNGHTHHMHVSILPGARDDTRSWFDTDDPDPVVVADPEEPVDYRYPNGVIVPLAPAPRWLVDLGQSTVGVAENGALYPTGDGAAAVEAGIAASGYREAFVSRTVHQCPSWDGSVLRIVSHLGEGYDIPVVFPPDPDAATIAGLEQRIADAKAALG